MRFSLSALILAAFCGLAGASLVIGTQFARRETVERIERERGSHEQLAHELSVELNRLDALYESHLRGLLTRAESDTGGGFVSACRNVRGVRHFSRLDAKPGAGDLQLDCRLPGMKPIPLPVFAGGSLFPGTQRREISPERFFDSNVPPSDWLREPGQPALFFTKRESEVRMLSIDEAEVLSAIEGWLGEWTSGPFANVAAAGGQDRVISPSRAVIANSGEQPSTVADWVLPVRSRFGAWRVESWDARTVRRSWHAPSLAWSAVGAITASLLGFALSSRIRSERRLAEQRVSFVNRVSHELRTPLTNMLLNLDAASEQIEEGAAARRLGLVREEARRLARLIENVLTFSRRDRGEIDVKARACDPAAIIDSVVEQFAQSFARREIRVRRTSESMRNCLLDGDALAQIIANLLSNVEKYAPVGTVDIRSRFEGHEFVIAVADEGPGVPASAAERVFLPFERLSSRLTEGVTGTGLGLAIARELAHRMGGTLKLMPSTRGAVFELRVPAPVVPGLGSFAA
jgi:signal transduction histidine kinase